MNKLTVVIFQSPSHDPRKRALEENILTALAHEPDVAVSVMPPLYELGEADASLVWLRSLTGPLLALAWLYPRAIHWILNSMGVKGRIGDTQLNRGEKTSESEGEGRKDAADVPDRTIWSLDLRDDDIAAMHVAEIQRIAREIRAASSAGSTTSAVPHSALRIPHSEMPSRRWYPVIDFGRCNNCMECIDFCLFGVYGVDDAARIVVENPDNCKPGCPACSRVCPENAILFPMHRTAAIAGAPGASTDARKLDLSELFGAPTAVQLAANERNTALARDGREAAAAPQHRPDKETKPKDNLDKLMDALDDAKL